MSVKSTMTKVLVYLAGIAFIFLGVLYFIDHSGRNVENPQKATGVIIKIKEASNSNTMLAHYEYSSFRPVVKFKTNSGEEVTFVELYAKDDKSDYKINTKVDVVYNEFNPEDAKLLQTNIFWGDHLILIGLGLLIIFLRIIA